MNKFGQILVVEYQSSVHVAAGWRSVDVVAEVELVSAGMVVVQQVELIDGEAPARGQSRTGARRQEFDGRYWAREQVGARKRLSACKVVSRVVHVERGENEFGQKLVARVLARAAEHYVVELRVDGALVAVDEGITEDYAVSVAQLMVFSRVGVTL